MNEGSTSTETSPPVLELRKIEKRYGGVRANAGVDFTLRRGEIHALVGENGAGKTTLMKIACGVARADSGTILRAGRRCVYPTPRHALVDGIAMVRQELKQPERLTVAENVVLGAEPVGRFGFLDKRSAERRTRELAERFGWRLDPGARTGRLPVSDRQRVEILRAVHRGVEVLVLDEPFSVLSTGGRRSLRRGLRAVAAAGTGIVVVSHKMREIRKIADQVTVLRDGRVVDVVSDTGEIEALAGGPGAARADRPSSAGRRPSSRTVLAVKDLYAAREGGGPGLRGASFAIGEGEVVGLAGVGGNGQRELVDVLTGSRPAASGAVELRGVSLLASGRGGIRGFGVGHIPADRDTDGVAASETVADNLIVSRHRSRPFSRLGWLDRRAATSLSRQLLSGFRIVAAGVHAPVSSLSGGNAQKLIVARELSSGPGLLIAEQPTRGVDADSTRAIRERLHSERDRGASILLVSSDTEELLTLSDRVLVIFDGRIAATFEDPAALSEAELGRHLLGVHSVGVSA